MADEVAGSIPAGGASLTRSFPAWARFCRHLTTRELRQVSSSFVEFRWSAVGQHGFHSAPICQTCDVGAEGDWLFPESRLAMSEEK